MSKEECTCDRCGGICKKSYNTGNYNVGNIIAIKPQYLYQGDIELYLCKECIKELLKSSNDSKPINNLKHGINMFEFLVETEENVHKNKRNQLVEILEKEYKCNFIIQEDDGFIKILYDDKSLRDRFEDDYSEFENAIDICSKYLNEDELWSVAICYDYLNEINKKEY